MLKLEDLIEHEKSLTDVLEGVQEELKAIQLVIKKMRKRCSKETSIPKQKQSKSLGITAGIRTYINEHAKGWFGSGIISDWIIENGIRPASKKGSVQGNVSNYLKKLAKRGELDQRNVGTSKNPRFEYRKKEEQLRIDQ